MDEHPRDDLESFVLGALSRADSDRLLLHADACPACAVLLADALAVAQELEGGVGVRPVRRSLPVRSQLGAIRRHATARQTLWPALAFIAAAAALIFGIWDLRASPYGPVVPVALLVHSHFEHHALHGKLGNAKVLQALDGSWIYLVADGLRPRTTYALWEEADGKVRVLGAFSSDAAGQAATYWKQPPTKIRTVVLGNARSSLGDPGNLRWP